MKERYKIGSSYYNLTYHKVLRNDDDKLLLGTILHDAKVIKICSDYPAQTQLQTKFHEVTHGIFHEYGIDGDEDEVDRMGNAFYAFIIDNTDFIKEILKFSVSLAKRGK